MYQLFIYVFVPIGEIFPGDACIANEEQEGMDSKNIVKCSTTFYWKLLCGV